jgi:amidase
VSLQAQTVAPFEVEEATIAQLHDSIRERRLTCRELVDAYIRRINTYDRNGQAINAIVIINPDAIKEAEEKDRCFAQSGLTGPLHCAPMTVKDNFKTKGLQTSNGALVFAGYQPKEDATEGARAKAAGAIVLAKSNMAEWAFSPVETASSILPVTRRIPTRWIG